MSVDFADWYRDRHGRVLSSLTLVCGSVDEAAEATDEAFARALAHWERVSAMANPAGWVYRVAVNHARRRANRRATETDLLTRQPMPPPTDGPAGEAWALVADLPPRQREVVVLRHIADLPTADIAEVLGISRGTVASTLHDAHRRLRAAVGDPGHDDRPASPVVTADDGATP